jgi:FAD binding domain
MLAGELALAGVDVAIVERRASQDLAGSRAGGLHSRTIEVLDQRGIADRFLSAGTVAQVAGFAWIPLSISDFPTRHNYGLALWQNHIERILAGWVDELAVPIYRGREATGFVQDDTGVDVELSDGQSLRADYLVGCEGGGSPIRKAAGIEFAGWDPTTSNLIAEVERDDRTNALRETMSELLGMDEPRKRVAGMMSGLDIHYDLGEGHPLLGRRMPDLDLVTAEGPLRVFTLLHDARPVLLNLGEPGGVDITPWADRVRLIDAVYDGMWELPALGEVAAPSAVLIRPDGYVAWGGEQTEAGVADALATWFGPPSAA